MQIGHKLITIKLHDIQTPANTGTSTYKHRMIPAHWHSYSPNTYELQASIRLCYRESCNCTFKVTTAFKNCA